MPSTRGGPRQLKRRLFKSLSTPLLNILPLDQELTNLAASKECRGLRALNNWQTTRKAAEFTTEKYARLKSSWGESRENAIACHGIQLLIITQRRYCSLCTWLWIEFVQVQTFCGPKEESCVENQTLKDPQCLLPCSGLYADITDDSLEQNIMQGIQMFFFFFRIFPFQVHLSQGTEHWLKNWLNMEDKKNISRMPFRRCSPIQVRRKRRNWSHSKINITDTKKNMSSISSLTRKSQA